MPSMRWGSGSLRWVRPLHGVVAMLGEEIVPVEIDGIVSGATTVGHRFHHPGDITIGGASDYIEKLRACHVIVDPGWYKKLKTATEDEEDMLDLAFGLTETSRLGCQIIMSDALDGLVVTLPAGVNNMFKG